MTDHPLLDRIREIGIIHPTDTLLLTTNESLTLEQADHIRHLVEDNMPGVNVVIISALTATVMRDDPPYQPQRIPDDTYTP